MIDNWHSYLCSVNVCSKCIYNSWTRILYYGDLAMQFWIKVTWCQNWDLTPEMLILQNPAVIVYLYIYECLTIQNHQPSPWMGHILTFMNTYDSRHEQPWILYLNECDTAKKNLETPITVWLMGCCYWLSEGKIY